MDLDGKIFAGVDEFDQKGDRFFKQAGKRDHVSGGGLDSARMRRVS